MTNTATQYKLGNANVQRRPDGTWFVYGLRNGTPYNAVLANESERDRYIALLNG